MEYHILGGKCVRVCGSEGARAIKKEINNECTENKEEVKDPLCDQCLLPLDWVSGFGFGFGLVKR